jgi:transcriptional regulator of acetoin/glycerol metabolism
VDGNVSHAAELLGITRPTLYALMHKYAARAT